jgi:hypothetical protein
VLTAAAAGCGGERYVSVYKSTLTVINEQNIHWDGSDGDSSSGGYNQEVLRDLLQSANLEPWRVSITINSDQRTCVHGYSKVSLMGTFEYMGRAGSFGSEHEVRHHVGSATPSAKRNHARCNALASKLIAAGVIKSLRTN